VRGEVKRRMGRSGRRRKRWSLGTQWKVFGWSSVKNKNSLSSRPQLASHGGMLDY
jgi:hypothetical protein